MVLMPALSPAGPTKRYACYFATYEACKRVLLREPSDEHEDSRGTVMFKTALSGALAGIAAWFPVYPGSKSVSYTHLTLPTICSV